MAKARFLPKKLGQNRSTWLLKFCRTEWGILGGGETFSVGDLNPERHMEGCRSQRCRGTWDPERHMPPN